MTEAIQNKRRTIDLKFQRTWNRWKGLFSYKMYHFLWKRKNVSESEAEKPEGRAKSHREQWPGPPSQGTAPGCYSELVSGVSSMCLVRFQITMEQWLWYASLSSHFSMGILCDYPVLCHQDKKKFGWCKWMMDEEKQKNSLVWMEFMKTLGGREQR